MLDRTLHFVRKLIPSSIFNFFQPIYHYKMAFLGALVYRFPSRKLTVIGVTGTKGKTSVTEILNTILEEAGYETALSNTIRFKIGSESKENLYKMSMPGRFFVQRFLRQAVRAGCTHVILEATSQGASLFRHKFIDFDGLIFTGIAPEHIEAHGSFEKYLEAKLTIAEAVAKSKKQRRVIVADKDNEHAEKFLAKNFAEKIPVSIHDAKPFKLLDTGSEFTIDGIVVKSHLQGEFNIWNQIAAIRMAKAFGVSLETSKRAIEKLTLIPGRVQKIKTGQDFTVVVDYAHTPDSLQKLYDTFKGKRRICLLGNTGGGRDIWKRDEMAKIAESECDEIILTNEDPYDDDPLEIVTDMAKAISAKKPHILMDRREAIAKAFSLARSGDIVLITGKGTDPYIMGPNNTKIPWSDAMVAKEELRKLTKTP